MTGVRGLIERHFAETLVGADRVLFEVYRTLGPDLREPLVPLGEGSDLGPGFACSPSPCPLPPGGERVLNGAEPLLSRMGEATPFPPPGTDGGGRGEGPPLPAAELERIHRGVRLPDGPGIPAPPEGVATGFVDKLVGAPALPEGVDAEAAVRYFLAMAEPGDGGSILKRVGVDVAGLRALHAAFRHKVPAFAGLQRAEARAYYVQRLRSVLGG